MQDAWLRLQRVDAEEIRDLQGWLTTIVSRLALDALRSARVRREAYVGPWLPEPIVQEPGPEERAEQAEEVSLALLVVLESLSGPERIAFVLHDVFGYAFDEVAAALGTSRRRRASTRRGRARRSRRGARASPRRRSSSARWSSRSARPRRGGRHRRAARAPAPGRRLHLRRRRARHRGAQADRGRRARRADGQGVATKGIAAGTTCEIVDVNGMPGWLGVGADGVIDRDELHGRRGRIARSTCSATPRSCGGCPDARRDVIDLAV